MTALRVALVEPRVTRTLYDAAWRDNQPIDDDSVLRRVLSEKGFDAESLLTRAVSPAVKAELRTNTDAAAATGACGVPTFVVHTADAEPTLFWGQDRLNMVARVAAGWNPPSL